MDVDRIQKINRLALDLMRQGLAPDRESAVAQAEKIFKINDSDGYNSMINTLNQVKSENKTEQRIETRSEETHSEDLSTKTPERRSSEGENDLSKEKIKDILNQNTKYIVEQLKSFQERVLTLEKELSSLKTKMAYQRIPTASEIISNKNFEPERRTEPTLNELKNQSEEEFKPVEKTAPTVQQPSYQQNNQQQNNHPRSGNYKDNDVSIEKFFYMGNK